MSRLNSNALFSLSASNSLLIPFCPFSSPQAPSKLKLNIAPAPEMKNKDIKMMSKIVNEGVEGTPVLAPTEDLALAVL